VTIYEKYAEWEIYLSETSNGILEKVLKIFHKWLSQYPAGQ